MLFAGVRLLDGDSAGRDSLLYSRGGQGRVASCCSGRGQHSAHGDVVEMSQEEFAHHRVSLQKFDRMTPSTNPGPMGEGGEASIQSEEMRSTCCLVAPTQALEGTPATRGLLHCDDTDTLPSCLCCSAPGCCGHGDLSTARHLLLGRPMFITLETTP